MKMPPARYMPFSSAHMSEPSWTFQPLPSSLVLTAKKPTTEHRMPTAGRKKASAIAAGPWPSRMLPSFLDWVTASVAAAMSEPTYDSNRSAPMPATSPTLSPTLSAITAGLCGSSSSMPASTLPTRSAPTSAACGCGGRRA